MTECSLRMPAAESFIWFRDRCRRTLKIAGSSVHHEIIHHASLGDINDNRFLNGVAVLTVALSVLIAGAFLLIWTNLNHWMTASESNIRIMVYLKDGTTEAQSQDTTYRIQGLNGVQKVQFISRSQALAAFKAQLKHQPSLLDGLGDNPLPDSLEVELKNGAVRLNRRLNPSLSRSHQNARG